MLCRPCFAWYVFRLSSAYCATKRGPWGRWTTCWGLEYAIRWNKCLRYGEVSNGMDVGSKRKEGLRD